MYKRMNRKLFCIIISHIYLLLLLNMIICGLNLDYDMLISVFTYFDLFAFILFILSNKEIDGNYFNISSLFIVFSHLFNFGQTYLYTFCPNYQYKTYNFLELNINYNADALLFAFNIIILVTIFVFLSVNSNSYFLCDKKGMIASAKQIRRIGWTIVIITLPMELYYFYKIMEISFAGGKYGLIYSAGFSGIFVTIASFVVVGFCMLICGYSDNKRKATIISVIASGIFAVSMVSGSRIYAVTSILVIFYCYINFVRKITFSRMLLYSAVGAFLLAVLHAIMLKRQGGEMSLISIIELAIKSENVFLGILDEFGGTIYTLSTTIKEVPIQMDFNYGLSYIGALSTVSLNFGDYLSIVNDNIEFTKLFLTRYPFGGSYIAELYYNFGYYSYLFAPVVGLLIGKASASMDYYAYRRDYLKFSVFIMVMYSLIIWIRSYSNILVRNIVWSALLIIIINQFFKKLQKENTKDNCTN